MEVVASTKSVASFAWQQELLHLQRGDLFAQEGEGERDKFCVTINMVLAHTETPDTSSRSGIGQRVCVC